VGVNRRERGRKGGVVRASRRERRWGREERRGNGGRSGGLCVAKWERERERERERAHAGERRGREKEKRGKKRDSAERGRVYVRGKKEKRDRVTHVSV
jgi:hypothetical protein